MSAPKGNHNATTFGLFTTGNLPAGFRDITRRCNRLRRTLRVDVESLHPGKPCNTAEEDLIDVAVKWEKHGGICARRLKTDTTLSVADHLNYSREVARSAAERSKAIQSLGLKTIAGAAGAADFYRTLSAMPAELTDQSAVSGAPVTTGQGSSPGIHPAGGVENNGEAA